MEGFLQSSLFNLVGALIGIGGIILAIIFYRRSKRVKKLSYAVRSFSLVSSSTSSLPEFLATYKGCPVTNLTAVKMILWNSGNETLAYSDIAKADQIRISLPPKVEILDVRVNVPSNPANLLKVHRNPEINEADIKFDYLGPKEGALISLLHTGGSESKPTIVGTIKGQGSPLIHTPGMTAKPMGRIIVLTAGFALVVITFKSVMSVSPYIGIPVLLGVWVLVFTHVMYLLRSERRKLGGIVERSFEDAFTAKDFI